MKLKKLIPIATFLTFSGAASATVMVTTEFNTVDGFVTGGTAPVTLDNLVTFSGGQQQQGFLGAAYNAGPAGYLFINGGGGFNGASSTGDTGLISFLGQGATTVSFHAADLANGAATTFTSFDASGNVLQTLMTQVDTLAGTDAAEILTFNAVGGVYISSIVADLPGPAANPPYAAAIDTFSATLVIPEPSSALLTGLALVIPVLRRRR